VNNIYLEPSTKAALIPSAEMALSRYDTLSDTQIDRILAGLAPAPQRNGWRPTSAVRVGREIRCTICGRTGHNRVRCGR
jgi:hypothetical protein